MTQFLRTLANPSVFWFLLLLYTHHCHPPPPQKSELNQRRSTRQKSCLCHPSVPWEQTKQVNIHITLECELQWSGHSVLSYAILSLCQRDSVKPRELLSESCLVQENQNPPLRK
ncbi:unnamed protein product [Rangifer tarandus platyrhynchus]|uniref:Uncharacterized protein n=2 Tax=Rangifer tarandus platyrhynchus TaxID=3082113 RepID=A0AC59YBH1_RANTA|nr:unnamed protein product [Rangifer tarandus platyrhynchus]